MTYMTSEEVHTKDVGRIRIATPIVIVKKEDASYRNTINTPLVDIPIISGRRCSCGRRDALYDGLGTRFVTGG